MTKTSQAPFRNFEIVTMIRTLAVNVAPIELIVRLTRIEPRFGGLVRSSRIQ